MTTTIHLPVAVGEQRFVLNHVSWETYESLMADYADSSSPRFTYCGGVLEIMSPTNEHKRLNLVLAAVAELVAEGTDTEFVALGSTTFRRKDLKHGTEPDSCFYFENAERIRNKEKLDLSTDPPPDLVIEVEITNPTVPKLPIYARMGVPEIWLYDGQAPKILRLVGGQYQACGRSDVLRPVTPNVLADFLEQSKTLATLAWRRKVRDWARAQKM